MDVWYNLAYDRAKELANDKKAKKIGADEICRCYIALYEDHDELVLALQTIRTITKD